MRARKGLLAVCTTLLTVACAGGRSQPAAYGDWFYTQRETRWTGWNASFAGTVSYNGTGAAGLVCTDQAPLIGLIHPKLDGADGEVRVRYRFGTDPYTDWADWSLASDRRSTQVPPHLVSRFLYRMTRDRILSVRMVDPAHNVELDLDFSLLGFTDAAIRLPCVEELFLTARDLNPGMVDSSVETPVTVRPSLLNRREAAAAIGYYYTPTLRYRGLRGRVTVQVFIDPAGGVAETRVAESSGYDELDRAALEVAEVLRFSPALDDGEEVPVWVSITIPFGVRR